MPENPHQPCPFEACGSSDAFSWNDGGYGKCHSCGRNYPEKGMDKTFGWAQEKYPTKSKDNTPRYWEVQPSSADFNNPRGLNEGVAKLYGIQSQYDEDGNIYRLALKWPETVQYRKVDEEQEGPKYRNKPGGGSFQFDLGGPDFNSGSSKRLYITEGLIDAASLYQALGETYPVKALPSASIGKEFLTKKGKQNYNYLSAFKEIVYAGELDVAGREAADFLYEAFPDKFYYAPLSKHKDSNEFLVNGDESDLKWSALKPQRYTPENFFTGDNAVEDAIRTENPYEYTPTGHRGLDEKLRGLVKGGITFIKAPRGTGKCLHPDQKVVMADGSLKAAKFVTKGDKLLGPDSKPRNVLSTASGQEEMFQITPVKGEPWACNKSHILHLYNYEKGKVNISVGEFMQLSEKEKKRYVQVRASRVDFQSSNELPYDPYFVGMYLGDGSRHNNCITLGKTKAALVEYLKDYCHELGWGLSEETMKGCTGYHIVSRGQFQNFKKGLFNGDSRMIPHEYKTASYEDRCKLLGGILDTDGHYGSGVFEVTQKSPVLAEDICFVARSLGLAAYKKEVTKSIKSSGFTGTYCRVYLSGDFTEIPCLRHTFQPRKQTKSVLRTGFTVQSLGKGNYCGFEIDGDKLFLLSDFTITHNTEIIRYFEMGLLESPDVGVALLHMEEMKSTTYRAMATYQLGVNVRTKDDAKDNGVTEEQVISAGKDATRGDRTLIFEMRAHDDPMKVLEYVRLASTVYGADYVFIDHVQRLAYLSSSGVDGATSTLTALGSQMAQLAKELNIGVIFISQVNDDGRTKYAAALEEEAIICIQISREVDSEDSVEQNTTKFYIDKNRPFAKLGDAGDVYYDPETTVLREDF
jgi:RecA/RadA recombinase